MDGSRNCPPPLFFCRSPPPAAPGGPGAGPVVVVVVPTHETNNSRSNFTVDLVTNPELLSVQVHAIDVVLYVATASSKNEIADCCPPVNRRSASLGVLFN